MVTRWLIRFTRTAGTGQKEYAITVETEQDLNRMLAAIESSKGWNLIDVTPMV